MVRFPEGVELDVKVGRGVTAAEEELVAEAVPEDVNTTEEFLEKEFLRVKLGIVELFRASALVSVAPGSVEELFDAQLVGVGTGADTEIEVGVNVETEVDVETMNVVDVLEVLQHSGSVIKK